MNEASEERTSSPLTPHSSRLSVIVAMAKNRVIGADNRIPWHLPAELKLFKNVTMGHHIVMGRRTWESINRLLPGRTSVIVTRQSDYSVPGAVVVHTLQEALAAGASDEEVFVIGGAELFKESLPLADRLHLTVVDTEPAGDTYMPPVDFSQWRAVSSELHPADARNPLAYEYTLYERA